MTTIPELGACLHVPVSEVIRMGEQQAVNPESTVFKSIEAGIAGKLAAFRAANVEAGRKKGGKSRVYIQHAVPSAYRYSLVSAFPNFDIKFTAADMRSGAVAIATATLVSEYMLAKYKVAHGRVIAYGISAKQIVMRNRSWVHLCLAGHSARVQAEFFRDDRAIAAVTHAMSSKGQTGTLCQAYVAGKVRVHCTNAAECQERGKVAVMLLNKTDTNFRQVAMYMRQHGATMLYFAIPGSKEMELGVEGPLKELDAYVFPSHGGERVNVCYKNAPAEDMTYLHANYLELVARTSVVIDGETYHKEFDNKLHGYLVYKVTRLPGTFQEPPVPYKSWIEPGYKNKYLVYIPELRPGGNVEDASHWSLRGVPVERGIVDDVVDFAMRAQGVPDIAQRIEKRLFTRTSNYSLVNQVVENSSAVPTHLFDALCLSLYCAVFMRKYKDGKAVSTLAPHARQVARMARAGSLSVAREYAGVLVGNLVRASGIVTDKLREIYYDSVADATLPLPSFSVCPGYVEYSDGGSSNPRFNGWLPEEFNATTGFTTMLPGVVHAALVDGLDSMSVVSAKTSVNHNLVDAMVATGEAYIAEDATLQAGEHDSLLRVACGLWETVVGVMHDIPPVEDSLGTSPFEQTPMLIPDSRADVVRQQSGLFKSVAQRVNPVVSSPLVNSIVQRVRGDTGGLVSVQRETPTQLIAAFSPGVPEVIPGAVADDPCQYIKDAVQTIFPNSLTMVTSQFETDRNYSSWDALAKAIHAKLDVSRISGLKPEAYYRPLLSGHVHPNVKDSFSTTFHSVNKRNFNTAASADAMDIEFLWSRAWRAMKQVYFQDGVDATLAALPYIGPTEESIHLWVSQLDEAKRTKLELAETGYTFPELLAGASDTQLMVKKKLKPTLDASYQSAVKYPQTIQYDATGKSVAVYSPMISEKVKREQSVLKPNVLVMQGKSVHDVNVFLNGFDWRPNEKGERWYIEVDYSQYDKSQGRRLAEMYLRYLGVFGVLPEYVSFVRDSQHSRTVAALKAGVKGWLADQNMSGAAYTLDRNNSINELVTAELLCEFLDQIEFIVIMGDDIVIAVRGEVNVKHWEDELSRKYNLTLKADIHRHGYICSMDICHLPGGHTRVVADVVKRALAFMDQSVTDEGKLMERYVSYCDNLQGVQDLHVQTYLAAALPARMRTYLPDTTSDAILCLVKAHAGLLRRSDDDEERYQKWRKFFSSIPYLRTY